ncbi:MAG: HI0074 family nucleotidyltransferase substrate-binding subunit [Chloroflexi bacterium]|nr:HI0074 family nucleotidyltransferase substrate-binding subunit [Chloroflexota bacterium]
MATLLDLSPLERAIAQLEESLDFVESELAESDPRVHKQFRAAAIQAFEFTYGLAFRMLRRHIELTADNPALVDEMTFADVIREAFRRDLVKSELEAWRDYRAKRGTTSHTYDEEMAQEVFDGIHAFLWDARYLLEQLRERNQDPDESR